MKNGNQPSIGSAIARVLIGYLIVATVLDIIESAAERGARKAMEKEKSKAA